MSARRIRTACLIALTAISIAAAGCGTGAGGSPSGGGGKATIVLANPAWSYELALYAVADALFAKKEGIDLEFVLIPGSTDASKQMAQGAGLAGAVGPEPVIIGSQPGRELGLRFYYLLYRDMIYELMVPADSEITSVRDLEGKRIGVSSLSSAAVVVTRSVLSSVGIDPESGARMVAIGVGSQAAAAVRQGQVDALALWDGQYAFMENHGIQLKKVPDQVTDSLIGNGLAVRDADLEAKMDMLTKVGRALAQGTLFSSVNPEAAVRVLWQEHPELKPAGVPEEQAIGDGVRVLKSRLANMELDSGQDQWGAMSADMYQHYVDFLDGQGLVDASQVDVANMFTNDLIAQVNDFDSEAVVKMAKNWKPEN